MQIVLLTLNTIILLDVMYINNGVIMLLMKLGENSISDIIIQLETVP